MRTSIAIMVVGLLMGLGVEGALGFSEEHEHTGLVGEAEARAREWPAGVVGMANDGRRAKWYTTWQSWGPGDVETFEFKVKSVGDVNALMGMLGKVKGAVMELSDEGAGVELRVGSQPAIDRWFKELSVEERRMSKVREPGAAMVPTLRLHVGQPAVDLEKLVVPGDVGVVMTAGLARDEKVGRFMAKHHEAERDETLAGMQKVMGEVPDRTNLPALDLKVGEVVKGEGYERRTVSFASVYGERVTAYLYVPTGLKEGERRPGVVAVQPTGEGGKVIVDGAGERGMARGYGRELAMRGYVVVAPDYPSFGEQKGYDFKTSKFASGTMKAISDNMRCVDLLESMKEVAPGKVGIIGHSLGGHNALFTAAFDQRIKGVVTSCGWTPFHFYYGGKKLVNWAQDRYMPRVRDVYGNDPDRMPFDFVGVMGAIAPRGVFSNSPVGDANFEVEGVRGAEGEIRKVYEGLGAAEMFVLTYPNYGHDFEEGERREAYRFMDGALGYRAVREVP